MIKNLTSLRFVFIFLIYLSHISYMGFPVFDFGGECGVSFFFVLSGFVLARRYGGEIESGAFKHKRFVLRQLAKFYPLHILLLLIGTLIGISQVDSGYLMKLLLSILLVQSWIPDVSYYYAGNAVSWFLADILFLYIVFPYLYRVAQLRWQRLVAVAVAVASLYMIYLSFVPVDRYNDFVYAPPLLRSIDFTLGILACRVHNSLGGSLSKRSAAYVWETATVALGVATFMAYPYIDPRFHCAMLLWPMSFLFVLVFALSDQSGTMLASLLHSRVLLFLGGISFEIFLTHPLINWNEYVILGKLGIDVASYTCLCVCLCFAGIALGSWIVKRYFVDRLYVLLTRKIQ